MDPEMQHPQLSLPRRHTFLFGLVVLVGIILYASFNLWVYRVATSGNATKTSKGFTLPKQGETFSETPSLAPPDTPTPQPTGPGPYACDMFGVCNFYEDTKRAGCPKTYADRRCLNECENKDVRCTK